MNGKSRIVSAGIAVLALGSICSASPINGSDPFAGFGASQNGADLSVSTIITDSAALTSGAGLGDFSPIPEFANFGPSTLNLTNFAAFTLNNAIYGSFATTSGSIITQTPDFLDVVLDGLYTPGPGLAAGLDPTVSSLRISINVSGGSLSEAITLNSPALQSQSNVPEPGTGVLLLLGGSLTLLGMFSRRFRSGRSQ
jgi:hypothetical protein